MYSLDRIRCIDFGDGEIQWLKGPFLHSAENPAIKKANGDEYWYQNGQQHRSDGPAVVMNDGTYFEYWINGIRLIDMPTDKLLNKEQLELYITFM